MKIAGLDIGTTGCKCSVFDEKGQYLSHAYRDYAVKRDITGHVIDMKDVKESVFQVVSEMALNYPDIGGIGVTSFGETMVLTDERGEPIVESMLYTDPRGQEECQKLVKLLGSRRIAQITGLRPHEMYGISKLMWLKKHYPEIYKKTCHVFQVEDWIVFSLSGVAQIDYSLATRTMAFDIENMVWSKEILNEAGIDVNLFSKPVPSGTIAGKVLSDVAKQTGLDINTLVVSVGQDQLAAAIGAGAFDSDVGVDGAGTVECLTPIYNEKPNIDEMYKGYYATVPYIIPGKYVAYAFSYTGGALTQWCTECMAKKEKELSISEDISVNEYLESEYVNKKRLMGQQGDEPSGLLVLPHFAGAATPYMDTGSKGAILGLTTDTSVAEIYHACLEGVCYEMYLNYKRLIDTGVHFNRIHATGGGARSKVWMQMKADVLNVPFIALSTIDAGTVGCAMVTGVAIGLFSDLNEASKLMVKKECIYEPREYQHSLYMNMFDKYKKLYDAVRFLV
ncbi:MAG: carbohydrate kinase [Lachnospiraceae bacterium]|nr:carbohydrate kinase [Lachnospiraceae bacterium]